ncbi:T9SS type A sorting domain-containing protein [Niastella caeni]|uniref:T9SS type A sorting domain-containing protein n=1 Tax=Niastella caeni TaxID=2569763 RepID=A0A4V4GZ70_9BACT|nr:MBG domain-containing protein [Niastella caeni]THU31526.1 T9SS type A sorting domain-containing protein [Niastella caeni]
MHTKRMMVMLITLLCSVTAFSQTIATVYTDKSDYQPGDVVIIEGDGWRPGEQVKLDIDHSTVTHGNTVLYATADSTGHIKNDQFTIQSFHLGESFIVTATGLSSGFIAETTFTDANIFTATISPISVNSGASGSYTIRVSNISNGGGAASVKSIAISIPTGFTSIATTAISTSGNASSPFVFETSAGFTNGYNSTTRQIRCKASGNGLPGNVTPAPWVDITFTATNPIVASQTNFTFLTQASELTTYAFSPPNNIPILKISGNDQQPFVTVLACAAPSVTSQPTSQTITYGNNTSFTFQTSSATYQWQESVNGGTTWTNISNGGVYAGATTNSLGLTKPPASYNGNQYRCMASFCTPAKTTTSNAVTLTVNKADLTVTADNKDRIYGEANPVFTVSYSGFITAENATSLTTAPTASGTATAASAVGTYAIIPAGGVSTNYNFIYVNGSLTINQRAIRVTADAKNKTYGDGDPAFTYNITEGSLAFSDAFSGALTRDAGEDIGNYDILQGTLALSNNYNLSYISADLTIGQRAITVTADEKNKTYGDSDPAFTYNITEGSLAFSDAFTGGLTRDPGENVGDYDILQGTLALNTNYNLSYVSADLTIGQRAITVTADAKNKTYGDGDPAFTYNITEGSLAFSDAFTGALTRDAGEDVGDYDILQGTLALNGNYNLSYVSADLTIGQRAITVTADAKNKTYGDGDPAFTYNITEGSLAFSDAFSGGLTRDPGEDVGDYDILQGTLALNGNYNLSYISADLTIGQRAITVTADAKNKTYGDGDPALTYNISEGSLAFSDAFTGALTRDPGEDVGDYDILQGTLALNGNYNLSYISADLTIGQRAITVTADAKNKTYGDNDPAFTYNITEGSLAFSDAFTGGLTRDPGENVGDYDILQGTLALNGNYNLSYISADLTIAQRAITVAADAKNKTYGDGDPAFTYNITEGSLAFSDAFSGALTRDAGEDVGDYDILQGTLALNTNYNLSYVSADLTIGQRVITVTADAKNKTYGDGDPAFTYNITEGSLAFSDAFTGGLTRDPGEDVGDYDILQGTLALNTNYNLSYASADLTIGQRAITVTADAKNKTYGDGDPAFTYNITEGSLAFSDAFSGALTRDPGEDVGDYDILQGTLALNTNYNLSYVSADLNIGQRAITVTADAKNKTYGDGDPAFTYNITEGNLAFSDAFTGGLTRDPGENVGDYDILQGTLALNTNYNLSYVSANLTIGQRAITVTADAKNKTYGDSDPAFTYNITEGSLAFSDAFSGALARDPGEDVGDYDILQGTLALNGNYNLSYVSADLTIGQRAITVTADAKNKTYGDGDPAFTYNITEGSLAFSDAFTGALTRDPGEDVGDYDILQGTLALNGNYNLSYISADLTIGQRAITVTADAKNKTYGDSDPAFTYNITEGSLAFSDAFTGGLTRDPGEDVGDYDILQGTLALNGNYNLSYISADLTIGQRAITVTADAKNKTYGDGDPAFTYNITEGNLAFSDAFSGALTRDPGENVGDYDILQGTVALNGNYNLSYISADLTIGQRAITVTADAKNKTYGDSDPAFTYNITEGSLAFSDAFTGGLTRDPGEDVGDYDILQGTLALNTNYNLSYASADLTIGQRAITVTADAKNKTYGDGDPAFTYNITEGSLAFSDAFSGALTRNAGEDVGDYDILQGTLALNGNYNLSYVSADLTIGQRAITVTADAKNKTYGDGDPAFTYNITEGSLAFSDAFSGALTRDPGEDVGDYDILQGTLALNGNYNLSYISANLTIGQRAITVTADAKNKTYGDGDPAFTYNITEGSLAFSDAFSGALTRDPGEDVGDYDILQGTLALNTNYNLSYVSADLNIGQRAITVTADAKNKTYGDGDPAFTYNITEGNLAFSDAFSGALTRDAGEDIGNYDILQGTLALSNNYNLSYIDNDFTINKRELTIIVNNKNKLYGAPIPVLDAIVTGIVATDNITVSYSTTATPASPIGPYPIIATLNDPDNRLTNYTMANTPATLTIAVVPVTTYVGTNVATQQYSDTVTFMATITGGAAVVTGANGAAVSVTFKVGNQTMGTVPLTVSGMNLVGVLENKQLVEGLAGQMTPGAKIVTAIFNTPNANYGFNYSNNTGTCSLTVAKENADITYTGQDYISLPSTTATSVTVSLSATIRDLFPSADGNRGNIKNARVTFRRDNPVSGPILGTANITPAMIADSTVGTVVTSFTYTLNNTEQQSGGANLQIYAIADNYYTGGTSDVATTITIARPGSEFVTGGGFLRNTSCAGAIAGTSTLKTNFGFNMQYNKSGSNLKGQCNIIIRSNGRIYQVKSNAVNTLVVSNATSSGTPAYFNTKANYSDITNPLSPIPMGGNMDLTVKMNDVSKGGQDDQVSILLMNPGTSQVIFSSNWSGVQTALQNLGGGNVSVRSTASGTSYTSTARVAQPEEIPAVVNSFAVKVFGNPASDYFNINIKGSAGKISVRVVDVQGRVIEYRETVPEGTLQLGQSYRSGFYYLEVRQGNNMKQIKLVKL